ncbi:MAG: transketolase family protein [Lachnospiraceae bacterium]|jgi:transketolase|nr:transketolase family protein [Lachnospiraceae bacterium]
MTKVSSRKAFTARLLECGRQDKSIWAIATDSRGSVTLNGFCDELTDQFIECGIAEQDAVGIAAGLAKTGKNVFVTGPACFLAARSYEQIKVDVAYNKTNVKIIGVSAGVSYGPLGCTHTTMHDFAGMRALPNITVVAPSDDVQTRWLTGELAKVQGPFYVRMGRGDVEGVYEAGESFSLGRAKTVREGTDVTIIACGEMVAPSVHAAELLKAWGIGARVLDMFTIKPLDEEAVRRACLETGGIVTVEEHSTLGGLGEAVSHVAAELAKAPVKTLGLPEEVIIGKNSELFAYYGLTAENIAAGAKALIGA